MRRSVFYVFQWLVAATFLCILTVVITVAVRTVVFGAAYWAVHDATPMMLSEVVRDPILIPAGVIAALLIWSCPWEQLFGDATPNDDFRRGRRIHGARDAEIQAYRDLVRRRNRHR